MSVLGAIYLEKILPATTPPVSVTCTAPTPDLLAANICLENCTFAIVIDDMAEWSKAVA